MRKWARKKLRRSLVLLVRKASKEETQENYRLGIYRHKGKK